MGPLAGIKVVEFAGIGPAPMCGMMLSDMGAEVYLVDRKNASAESDAQGSKRDMIKRGKIPVNVDLKNLAAVELVLTMIEKADVVIESFRPGVMERLGLGPEVCLQRNKALVYCRLSGWGQTGPMSQVAGHDPNYVSLSGALYHSGSADRPPQAVPGLLGDAAGGTAIMAWGLTCALLHAEKTGIGQVIDAAMTEGLNYLTSSVRTLYQAGQLTDDRGSQWTDGAAPWFQTYRCSDEGFISINAVEGKFYKLLLSKLELDDDPDFATDQWDANNWAVQKQRLTTLFLTRTRDGWCDLLEGTDACFTPVLTYGEAHSHPQHQAREAFKEVDGEWHPTPAPRFSVTHAEPNWHENEEQDLTEVLSNLGIDVEMLKDLQTSQK